MAWGEQDLFGHVNNIVYFRYFESVRMHYLERIGVLRSYAETGVGVILASTHCDFHRPVFWPTTLRVRTGCVKVGHTSFTMTYTITDQNGDRIASWTSVQVMYDHRAGSKVPIPADVRDAIANLQAH